MHSLCYTHTSSFSVLYRNTHKTKPLNPRQKMSVRNQDSLCIVLSGRKQQSRAEGPASKSPAFSVAADLEKQVCLPGCPSALLDLEPAAMPLLALPSILPGSVLRWGSLYSSPPPQGWEEAGIAAGCPRVWGHFHPQDKPKKLSFVLQMRKLGLRPRGCLKNTCLWQNLDLLSDLLTQILFLTSP